LYSGLLRVSVSLLFNALPLLAHTIPLSEVLEGICLSNRPGRPSCEGLAQDPQFQNRPSPHLRGLVQSVQRSGRPECEQVSKTPLEDQYMYEVQVLYIVMSQLLNVRRVNSKATLKVPLGSLLPLVPRLLHQPLRDSRYHADRSQSLVIQADEERKQSNNVESCYDKLFQLLQTSAKAVIPGETTREQRDRVHKFVPRQRAQNEGRIKAKKQHSEKKSSRRGSKYDD
ncbi:hypothetical protein N7452_005158, partial [Penicillium brevicompactum]